MSKPEKVIPEKVVGFQITPNTKSYTQKDAIVYALGVGACKDPLDESEFKFGYELAQDFSALPTMAVCFPSFDGLFEAMNACPGMPNFNPMMLLHGEQKLVIKNPLPSSATITNKAVITNVEDKGKGALLSVDITSSDENGQVLCVNTTRTFIRGIGGFGGPKSASAPLPAAPKRPADKSQAYKTEPNQAFLYRLSGDPNPLHVDPNMAAMGGFDRPILHGLCTFGHAGRAILKHFCDNDVNKFKSIEGRFSSHVFPGETLVTEMWVENGKVLFQVKNQERGTVCLSNGVAEVEGLSSAPQSRL